MNWKSIIWTVATFGAGATCGYFIGKKTEEEYWKKRIDAETDAFSNEISDMDKKVKELKQALNKVYGVGSLAEQEEAVTPKERRKLSEEVEKARQAALRNHALTEQYQKYSELYQKHDDWEGAPVHSKEPVVSEEEREETEESEYEDLLKEEEERLEKLRTEKPCVIITPEEMGDLPGYTDTVVLLYYADSDILTEEDGTLIDDPELLVGECLDESGFRDTTQDFLQVWNQDHRTIYEITKVPISYEED